MSGLLMALVGEDGRGNGEGREAMGFGLDEMEQLRGREWARVRNWWHRIEIEEELIGVSFRGIHGLLFC